MVMVKIGLSAILVELMKDRSVEEMQQAYLQMIKQIKQAGVQPKKHVIDNEISEVLPEMIEQECRIKLVPPACHKHDIVEVAIKCSKPTS